MRQLIFFARPDRFREPRSYFMPARSCEIEYLTIRKSSRTEHVGSAALAVPHSRPHRGRSCIPNFVSFSFISPRHLHRGVSRRSQPLAAGRELRSRAIRQRNAAIVNSFGVRMPAASRMPGEQQPYTRDITNAKSLAGCSANCRWKIQIEIKASKKLNWTNCTN